MDIEELQKENEKLCVQKGYLISLIVVLFMTFIVIEYFTLKETKNAITQLETMVQSLNQLLQNERKEKATSQNAEMQKRFESIEQNIDEIIKQVEKKH